MTADVIIGGHLANGMLNHFRNLRRRCADFVVAIVVVGGVHCWRC